MWKNEILIVICLQLEDRSQSQLMVLDLNVENQLMIQVEVLLNTYIERFYRLSIVEYHRHDH